MKRNTSIGSRLLATTLTVLLVFTPTLVFADPETAREYYSQASEAYNNGDLERAADLLERAYAEDPNLVYQYNRILALRGLGRFKEALRVLEVYENPMRDDERQRFTDIDEIKADLEKSIAEQQAKPDPGDGDKGDSDKGNGDKGNGDKGDGDGDGGKGDGDKIEDPPPPPENVPWLGYTLMGAGIISIGLGSLFASGVLVSEELDRASCASDAIAANPIMRDNDAFKVCGYVATFGNPGSSLEYENLTSSYRSDVDAIESQQVLAGVFLGTGAALLIAGGVVWLVTGDEPSSARASADSPRLQVAPYVSHDGWGGALRLDF